VDRTEIKKTCLRDWVDQDIEIAPVGVVAVYQGTEDTRIPGSMGFHHTSDNITMGGKRY
jgi:hypothetical protein